MSQRSIISASLLSVILFSNLSIIYAASFPASNSNTGNFGIPTSPTTNQMKTSGSQDSAATEDKEQQEPNPILYENYQQCFASLISDVVGRPLEEFEGRKLTIKKYCRAISTVKYQKRFSDCFNSQIKSGNNIDLIISDCVSSNEKLQK
jgi:hypothetical protein